jgi:hypothetical protein
MILEARFSGLPDARDLAIINWSPPIIFEADGSSDDQTIQLSDPNSDTIYSLTLRGLTGGVLVTRDSSTNAAK